MIRVLIADDHAVVRLGLKQILSETMDLTIAGEASNGFEVLEKVREDQYDVIVLDITMPGMSGLDVLKQLKAEFPSLPVLILSMHSEEQYAVRALKAGAAGYLTKDRAPEELVSAINLLSQGRRYVTSSLAEKLAIALDMDSQKMPHELLSDREYQVLCFIGQGKTITQISEELHLSAKTISTYRARILQKMKMSNNAELIRYVLKNKLLE
ncbi:MAG: response regulator transcription factor [candidate division KSB1 bacterium]|jgi:DNA-binding NarL/FixJ family response regulator|nr:response regulator transcription factor [candidate division KSB1 bacterium]